MEALAPAFPNVVVLAGGVGGAKLVEGLASVLDPSRLTVVVNTGDDFVHLGLYICPDLDTITYTLAGLAHRGQGWGVANETFQALDMVRALGGPSWFMLGDRDLGTHLVRSARLAQHQRLTEITRAIAQAHGIGPRILPMCDAHRTTLVDTHDEGTLDFQSWLVGRKGEPRVRAIRFSGDPLPTPEVVDAMERADLVVIAPSNPYVSIDPILTLEGLRERVAKKRVIAISPIVGGRAVKGPLASMIPDLARVPPSARAVAEHYGALLDAYVVETGDAHADVPTLETSIVMRTVEDRGVLARAALSFANDVLA